MRAAIYARVSTERQGRDQTIDSQLDALRRWAAAHGHELKDDHVYIDEGYSGARLDRPALDRLRDAAREGEFDVIGVYSPDRLARRYAYQILLLEEFRKAACDVEFIERPISDDPHDQLLLRIQGAIAEYERAVLAERFRRGKLQKARAGEWVGGQGSYGYRYVPRRDGVPGHLEIDEDEAAVVRMLYRWLIDERMTVRQIIKRLAAGPWRPRNGKRIWSNAVVHRILSDPLYAGTAYANRYAHVAPRKPRSAGPRAGLPTCRKPRPREEWIPIPVPAIIDAATYRVASEQLARNSALSFRNNTRNDYLLRCLLTCRTCGFAMCGVTSSGAGGRRQHRYYICHGKDTRARDRSHPCPQPRTRVEELDAAVWDQVRRLLDDPASLAAQFEEQARQADALDAGADAASQKCEALLRRLDREEQRLLDAYQAEAIDLDELKRRREQIQGRRVVLTAQRGQEQRLRRERQTAKEAWADLTAFCQRVRSRLDEATLAEKQRILQLLIDRVIVGEDALEIRHVIPLGRLKAEPAEPGPTDPTGSGGGEGGEPEGSPPSGPGARLRSDGVEDTQLVAGLRPEFLQDLPIEIRAVGHHHLGGQPPRLEVLQEPPHVAGIVGRDEGEGHRQVLERVGGQEQRRAAEVQLIDAEGPAEPLQDPAAMVGQVQPSGLPVEAVGDEAVGQVEIEVPSHRGDHSLDAHAVVEDAVEDGLADGMVIGGLGLDARRGGAEGRAATTSGPVLAVGDIEVDDPLVGDGPDPAMVDGLAPPEPAAVRAGGLARGAADG
jgi:site-specific DNA recombinase